MAKKDKAKKAGRKRRQSRKRTVSYNRQEPWFLGRDYNPMSTIHQINKYNHAVENLESLRRYTGRENELKKHFDRLNDTQTSLYDRVGQQDQKVDAVRRDYEARASAQDQKATSRAAGLERLINNYGVSNRQQLLNFQRELGRYEESLQRLQQQQNVQRTPRVPPPPDETPPSRFKGFRRPDSPPPDDSPGSVSTPGSVFLQPGSVELPHGLTPPPSATSTPLTPARETETTARAVSFGAVSTIQPENLSQSRFSPEPTPRAAPSAEIDEAAAAAEASVARQAEEAAALEGEGGFELVPPAVGGAISGLDLTFSGVPAAPDASVLRSPESGVQIPESPSEQPAGARVTEVGMPRRATLVEEAAPPLAPIKKPEEALTPESAQSVIAARSNLKEIVSKVNPYHQQRDNVQLSNRTVSVEELDDTRRSLARTIESARDFTLPDPTTPEDSRAAKELLAKLRETRANLRAGTYKRDEAERTGQVTSQRGTDTPESLG
jgi:hypothetical protein